MLVDFLDLLVELISLEVDIRQYNLLGGGEERAEIPWLCARRRTARVGVGEDGWTGWE